MSRPYTRGRYEPGHALRQAETRLSYVIHFLVNNRLALVDESDRRVDQGLPVLTHLSLDGSGGGIFRVPWSENERFIQAFVRAQNDFLQGQTMRDPYWLSPPPAMAEFLANCEFIRPVFDLDLWDEGEYVLGSPKYMLLRRRITWQVYNIFYFFRKLFPDHVAESANLSGKADDVPVHSKAISFDSSLDWHTLDMAVLESPCKIQSKSFNGERKEGIKHSFHLRFPMMRIPFTLMMVIFPFLVKHLEDECPRSSDLDGSPLDIQSNNWFDALDSRILSAGVKLPGSQKAVQCRDCHKLVEREKERERQAKAQRLIANSATAQMLKGTRGRSKEKRPVPDDDIEVAENNHFIPVMYKHQVQSMIDSFSSNGIGSASVRYGTIRCGNPMCSNMRVYDGRFHSFLGIWDSLVETDCVRVRDVVDLIHPAKSEEFASDKVRMLTMLQSRTSFRSTNVHVDPHINLEAYINMYEESMVKPMKRALNHNKKPRDDAPETDAVAAPALGRSLKEAMDVRTLFRKTMLRQPLTTLQKQTALQLARSHSPCYSALEQGRIIVLQDSMILVPLADEVGRFCLNKKSTHNSSTVYFSFCLNAREQPIMSIGCYCTKIDSSKPTPSCKDYYSKMHNQLARIIKSEVARVLFAPYYEEKAKRDSEDEVANNTTAEKGKSMQIEDILSNSTCKRYKKLLTVREADSIERQARLTKPIQSTENLLVPSTSESRTLMQLVAQYSGPHTQMERSLTPMNVMLQSQGVACPQSPLSRPQSSLAQEGWSQPLEETEEDLEDLVRSLSSGRK